MTAKMTTRTELIASLRSHVIDHKRDNKAADMLEADDKLRAAATLALKELTTANSVSDMAGEFDHVVYRLTEAL